MGGTAQDVETGGINPLPEGFGSSFNEKRIRLKFVRKVYAILMSQLSLTTITIGVFCFTPAIKRFYCSDVALNAAGSLQCVNASLYGLSLYWGSYLVFIITYFTLICSSNVRRKSPGNVIALLVFTAAVSLMLANIALYHDVNWVMLAIGITALLCLGLTLFACQTKVDVTGWGIYLFAACWILFIFAILMMVFFLKSYPLMGVVYSGLLALLFSLFFIYHTQLMLGSKKYRLSPEESIFAATQLYVDVANIFMGILGLGGGR
ncbi:hypothetical protein TCAL_08186 [Tigriopus californicus]|uniref:Uncharacterized protein n=1 Tax=Tigriopus californicus TaxID=6832 RepID=A0A553NDP1_TIGCA|nr:protein lifeguard 1-like [Tigriopus californicus]TRY63469.1 hypothetical protein TCAL_08186 [Tigriopus californicus]|eukprot:TCALIF_08186-PA protein Name:"Similar to GRINA Protein lifeguard 1 (Homo sapiens)" AED:0.02 eAED:0.02 QI:100/1/0.5/1/1/1/2/0/262